MTWSFFPVARHLGTLCLVLTLATDCLLAQEAQKNTPTVERILAAWAQRRDAIKSLHYECDLKETLIKPVWPGNTNPFGDAPPEAPTTKVVLDQTISFSMDGRKLAYQKEGQQWDEFHRIEKPYFFRAVFDGATQRELLQTDAMPLGSLDRRGRPNDSVTAGVHEIAFWLAWDPFTFLDRQVYHVERMLIQTTWTSGEGHQRVDVVLPRGKNTRWIGLLCLDASRDYVPVQFIQQYKGVPRSQLDIEYTKNDQAGWVVSSWTRMQVNASDQAPDFYRGTVRKCLVNAKLDKQLFTLEFPPGTHVVEKTDQGHKYFIQLPDGSLESIPEDEYGRTDPDAT